ncbi:MAG TPA: hypothetical protein VG389_17030 [Myxococcota bacterium]|nr:hypothetical protein [Myxococcota bacterium]
MQLDFAKRELTLKLVYYGPSLSGKTTNLQVLYRLVDPAVRGRLTQLDTRDDRTLFFDLLPVHFTTRSGLTVKIKVFTVPGQVMHNSTRRVLLAAVDAIAFVADSQIALARENAESFRGMQDNLRENGIDPAGVPVVVQFNKRDMPDIRTDEELDELARRSRERIYRAVAVRGVGVLETFNGLLDVLWESLESSVDIGAKFGVTRAEFLAGVFRHLNVQMPTAPGGAS